LARASHGERKTWEPHKITAERVFEVLVAASQRNLKLVEVSLGSSTSV
jgi:hypothetical protein